MELYLHCHNTPSWRGAKLKNARGQLYLYFLHSNRCVTLDACSFRCKACTLFLKMFWMTHGNYLVVKRNREWANMWYRNFLHTTVFILECTPQVCKRP
jgi:hypothetical protein